MQTRTDVDVGAGVVVSVGEAVGVDVGSCGGVSVGEGVGFEVGAGVGVDVGAGVGVDVGAGVGLHAQTACAMLIFTPIHTSPRTRVDPCRSPRVTKYVNIQRHRVPRLAVTVYTH